MTFLRNIWYVAAWAEEVCEKAPLARRILGEGVLLIRDAEGRPAALPNRCPHRFALLSRGRITNGVIQCGYHGLEFNAEGRCIHNPHGDGVIAPSAHLRPYPIVERHQALWIWMGDQPANPDLIPDFSMVINDRMRATRRYLHPQANYELLADNLLDLGHASYLHGDSLGSKAIIRSDRQVKRVGDTVVYELWAPDGAAPPLFQQVMPWYRDQPVDHWMVSTWHAPGMIQQQVAFAPAGSNRIGGDVLEGLHWLTPETDQSTHYFAALARAFRTEEAEVDEILLSAGKKAFTEEDFPMIESIQREIGDADFWGLHPLILSVDSGAVMARRILRQKLDAEAAKKPQNSPAAAA